jgi:hypothetical protein
MVRLLFTLLVSILSVRAAAAPPIIDANVFYFSDDFSYNDTSSSYSRTMYDLAVGLTLTKKGRWALAWNYASYSLSETPDTQETSLSITDMGPKIFYYLDKDKTWVIAFTYNLITTADYSDGAGESTELRGSSMKAEAGYLPMMWEGIYMGAKLNYYKASFKEEITGQTSLEQVTHARTVIYPSFSMTVRW